MEQQKKEMTNKIVWALKTGDIDEVLVYLKTADDVNRVLEERWQRSPLHIAADFGQLAVMQYLIETGADVNVVDANGFTPLICACFESHSPCVKLLLAKGADKERKALNGLSALDAAVLPEIKELLQ